MFRVEGVLEAQAERPVGAHFGLTGRKYQSGETDLTGRHSKCGDREVRAALYEVANVILSRPGKSTALKYWGMNLPQPCWTKKAKVAVARKLAVILHRMLADGAEFVSASAARLITRIGEQAPEYRAGLRRPRRGRSPFAGTHGTGQAVRRQAATILNCANLDWLAVPLRTSSSSTRALTTDRSMRRAE
ncbi:MAG: transposase [Hyphomonadaceae bacterium]|nr:transposase [Hyphomonadaceae bacterium]